MSKRSANDSKDCYGRPKRTRGVEEKEDGAETGSESLCPSSSSEAVNSQSSRDLMALLFKSLEDKNVIYVDNVNAFLIGLLHKEDERETKEENGEAAVCAICKESEPNAKILPCGHSASCSMCTQAVIDIGNGSGKCPFCREEVRVIVGGRLFCYSILTHCVSV